MLSNVMPFMCYINASMSLVLVVSSLHGSVPRLYPLAFSSNCLLADRCVSIPKLYTPIHVRCKSM